MPTSCSSTSAEPFRPRSRDRPRRRRSAYPNRSPATMPIARRAASRISSRSSAEAGGFGLAGEARDRAREGEEVERLLEVVLESRRDRFFAIVLVAVGGDGDGGERGQAFQRPHLSQQ